MLLIPAAHQRCERRSLDGTLLRSVSQKRIGHLEIEVVGLFASPTTFCTVPSGSLVSERVAQAGYPIGHGSALIHPQHISIGAACEPCLDAAAEYLELTVTNRESNTKMPLSTLFMSHRLR